MADEKHENGPVPEQAVADDQPVEVEGVSVEEADGESTAEERLALSEARVAELEREIVYLHAEQENFKRRAEKRYRDSLEYASEPLLRALLPVLDNLERAVEHARESGTEGHDSLLEGLGHVISQFGDVLQGHGVDPVPASGERFNPDLHEALVVVDGEEDGKVGDVFEKGYTLKGRLLRPAKVTVTKVAGGGGDG